MSIEALQRELQNPSEMEIELKQRLSRLTDHLIQKQAQVWSSLNHDNGSNSLGSYVLNAKNTTFLYNYQTAKDAPST